MWGCIFRLGGGYISLKLAMKSPLQDRYHEKPPVLKDHTFLAEDPKF